MATSVFKKLCCLTLFTAASFLSVVAQNGSTLYEAESAQLSSCTIVTDSRYSGQKAVRMTESAASATLTINWEERQRCSIYVAAEGIGGTKEIRCTINGASTLFKAGTYSEVAIGDFFLKQGSNSIVITPSWTWFNIDYVRIVPCEETIAFDIQDRPVTSEATPAAKALYHFLYENFGKRTIAGIMTGNMDGSDGQNIKAHEDVMAVFNASGHYPALVGFDFMNTTGRDTDNNNSWFKSYAAKVVSLAKDTWNKGGIPDFSWHWRDPSRQTGEFYTDKVSFNFTSAFNADGTWNTSSALYRNLIKDIDAVADCFLQLQRENMACIFRPLHEASGGWFWWGAQGAEPCKKLYRLIYEEMVHVKGVHNVIWDWNADYKLGNLWCPGDEYYDVISTDIYNDAFDYSSNYPAFEQLKTLSGAHKIITLAENGPIPDIDRQQEDEAMWSWWMPWYQSWNGGFVSKTSDEEWQKCMNDPRVITLEDMPGWNSYIAHISPTNHPSAKGACFNLYGIRQDQPQQGQLYIIDGKKKLFGKSH